MRDTYTAGDKDFSAIVSKMKDEKIDAVYVGGYHPDVALMMRRPASRASRRRSCPATR
jgi:branched-chain amino acid transport system substrate-binding protein